MTASLTARIVTRIGELDAPAWDALSGGACCISHAMLSALEDSGSVGEGTGWHPRHLVLEDPSGLVAAMPLYEKLHSYGEYVFDWAWADAYQRHGLAYYPKWLSAVPFTPVPGPRLLARDTASREALLRTARGLAEESGLSSMHILLPDETEAAALAAGGFMLRSGVQFHWQQRDYADFEDFLAKLNHAKRKKIRQERRRAAEHELECVWLDGHTATAADWAFFHRCYAMTYALHRSTPYLSAEFFPMLAARMPENVRLLLARRKGQAVAGAFFLKDEHALYGRYWGASEHLPFLHFELCYYRAIEYCIAHDIPRFEGGAQGEHKLSRGLEPVVTRSAHWLRDERFADAVDRFLARESEGIGFYLDELSERLPFRREQS
ncbi:MAG: GNAT family N-acetyltransferase [Pseudazoarcus pumilus]|nr:GNAT family N-acetyltransferase [Pseudazoarcus pumilus]